MNSSTLHIDRLVINFDPRTVPRPDLGHATDSDPGSLLDSNTAYTLPILLICPQPRPLKQIYVSRSHYLAAPATATLPPVGRLAPNLRQARFVLKYKRESKTIFAVGLRSVNESSGGPLPSLHTYTPQPPSISSVIPPSDIIFLLKKPTTQ
ncbi:hypothetical protein EVAR_10076_1 [Eumeta japonica]|uniref:Uncharacterized protein n=1 Tax=Eumeta variegata TaxID=151549 RepID=A0A4C1TRA8_EUMVA|nr:hypothetical protein EVAR_10076_1 [Eumeta japonica]